MNDIKECIHEPILGTYEISANRANAQCVKCGNKIQMIWNAKLTTNWHIARGQK